MTVQGDTYRLFIWHPIRGVTHEAWAEADYLLHSMRERMQTDLCYAPYLPEYYAFDLHQHSWWYYCKEIPCPDPDIPRTSMQVRMQQKNPWQQRLPEGVPKEIRAYHLLLG